MSNKEEIARLRKEADALENADKAFSELPEDQQLAITLHNMLCRQNHTDGCGWEYEYIEKPKGWTGPSAPDWNGWTHKRYLEKAQVMQACCKKNHIPVDVAIEVLNIAQSF